MSIIYSYPTTSPTLDDLLIGTDVGEDNATKSFSVQSLVSLINASQNNGIITDVTISTSDIFLTAVKTSGIGVPAITYTVGLTSLPTAGIEATQFLRGDNQWVVPTVSAGIGVTSNSNPITSDVSNFDFTGAGVSTSSDVNGNVIITIEGATNAVESIVASTGIGLSSETGNVIVTNTGITSLVEGGGITIATNSTGQATLTVAAQGGGTVTSVGAGDGLVITNSDATSPIIALDYTGADTYITQPVAAIPLAADLIPFHSVSGSTVSKVTFGDIQASTLALVNTSITTANADALTNTYDKSQQAASPNNRTVGAVPATQIVTCSAAEYTTMANANELVDSFIYLTTQNSAPQNTVNFTINSGTISASGGCSVSTSTTVNNNAVLTVTGAVGSSYTVITTISPSGGCSFSGTNPQTLTGTIPAGSTAAVTQNLTGSVYVPAAAQGSNTLNVNTAISGGTVGVEYTVSPTSGSSTGNLGTAVPSYGVAATILVPAQYELTAGSLTATQSASTYTSGGSIANASFPGTTIAIRSYDVTYAITLGSGLVLADKGTTWDILVTGIFSGNAQNSAAPVSRQYDTTNSGYTFGATVVSVANSGYNVSGASWSGPTAGPVTAATNITGTLDATVSASTGNASMTLANNGINGPANGYTVSYTADGSPYTIGSAVSGTVGTSVTFNTILTVNNNYTATTALSASYTNGTSVPIEQTTAVTLAGTVMADRGQGVYNSTWDVSSNEACQEGNPTETVYLSVGGSNIYAGVTCYTSATGSGVVANGYYKANNNNSWMRITGGSGVVQSTGSC